MYDQLIPVNNTDPCHLPQKGTKRRSDFVDGPPCKRSDNDGKENLYSDMYTISPTYPANSWFSEQQNFFQTFNGVFSSSPKSQMFQGNFLRMPSQVPSICQTQTQLSADASVKPEGRAYAAAECEALGGDLNIVVPEPKPLNPLPFNSSEVFDETTGRLCLFNSSTKYKVTLGEVRRRLSHPETLHASLINSILRKAKLKDGCRRLRSRLAEKGVVLPSGRRKTATTTVFTALCEKEAVLMARDFDSLCRNTLNTYEIARRASRSVYGVQELEASSRVLASILETFEEVPENPEDYVEKDASTYTINMLSMLTHGFGHNAVKSVIRFILEVIHQQKMVLLGAGTNLQRPGAYPACPQPAPPFA